MPGKVGDFRRQTFDLSKIDAAGKSVGRTAYWRLYAIENLARILTHSILLEQIGPNWWEVGVGRDIKGRVAGFRRNYAQQPWHSTPGRHNLYYTQLPDLATIIRTNSHLFLPIIPDVDAWVGRLDQIRLPRNVVGHMNWPSANDQKRIQTFYSDFHALIRHLVASGQMLVIP